MDNLVQVLNKMQFSFQKELIFEIQIIKILDELNVSRETLKDDNIKIIKQKQIKEKKQANDELNEIIDELKNTRINNILKESSHSEIKFIDDSWENINEYLIEEKYKKIAGILLESKPVAASKKGILITLPTRSMLQDIENNYDLSKELLNRIFNNEYKIVYLLDEYWKKIRYGCIMEKVSAL